MKKKPSLCMGRGPVVPAKLRRGMTVNQIVDNFSKSGAFNAGRLAEACLLFRRMVEEDCTIAITLSGALTPAGMGGSIISAMEAGFIDFIVSTGANLYHDIHFAFGMPVSKGDFRADDRRLRRAGIERIYDVFITSRMLFDTDAFVRKVVKSIRAPGPVASSMLHNELGAALLREAPHPENSVLATAARLAIPVFAPAPGDSSIGMQVAALKLCGGGLTIDPDLDVLHSAAIVFGSPKTAALELGGGTPKNFFLQTQPFLWEVLGINKGGHDYVIQVTTDAPHWGGLSGATPNEAISWGKIKAELVNNHVVVYSDATIGMPIILADALSACRGRRQRRLYGKLEGLVANMKAALRKKL